VDAPDSARPQVGGPGAGLIFAGVLNLLLPLTVCVAPLATTLLAASREPDGLYAVATDDRATLPAATWLTLPAAALSLVVGAPLGLTMLLGGIKMRSLSLYGLAVTASVFALLPLSPVFVISLPIGIWALAVLSRAEVKEAFRRNRGGRGPARRAAPTGPSVERRDTPAAVSATAAPATVKPDVPPAEAPGAAAPFAQDQAGADFARARRLVAQPAIGMMFAGALNAAGATAIAAWVTYLVVSAEMNPSLRVFAAIAAVLNLGISAHWIWRGVSMLRLRAHGSVVLAAVVAILPLWPAWIVSMPVGIWALVVLCMSDVRAAFRARENLRLARSPVSFAGASGLIARSAEGTLAAQDEPDAHRAVAAEVRKPAVLLIIAAVFTVPGVVGLLAAAAEGLDDFRGIEGELVITSIVVASLAAALFAAALIFGAALDMMNLVGHRRAVVGSVAALLTGSGLLIGGAAIWALVVLSAARVKAMFSEQPISRGRKAALGAMAWTAAVAVLALFVHAVWEPVGDYAPATYDVTTDAILTPQSPTFTIQAVRTGRGRCRAGQPLSTLEMTELTLYVQPKSFPNNRVKAGKMEIDLRNMRFAYRDREGDRVVGTLNHDQVFLDWFTACGIDTGEPWGVGAAALNLLDIAKGAATQPVERLADPGVFSAHTLHPGDWKIKVDSWVLPAVWAAWGGLLLLGIGGCWLLSRGQ
jgi:hypothetical protein